MDFVEYVHVMVVVNQHIPGMNQVERVIDGDIEKVSFPDVIRESRKTLEVSGFLIDANDHAVGFYLFAKPSQNGACPRTQFQARPTWLNSCALKKRNCCRIVGRLNHSQPMIFTVISVALEYIYMCSWDFPVTLMW
jgi:hypothetical protein